MSSKLKQVGLVASGLIAGIFISLNYSASAGKDAATAALPIEELRSFADVYNATLVHREDHRVDHAEHAHHH